MSSVASGATADVASPAEPRPFCFNTSAHLLRIGRERATTLSELLQALRTCSENSIFQHTFRTLQEHHFIARDFPTTLLIGHSRHATNVGSQNAWPV